MPCPLLEDSLASTIVRKAAQSGRLAVCILSQHPLVLAEFERQLASPNFRVNPRKLDSMLGPELRRLALPRAKVYVVDAHAARPATAALITNILTRYPAARVLVVSEKLSANDNETFLRLGVKGLLTYLEAREKLPQALSLVSKGGFWVARTVLAGFVDTILTSSRGRNLKSNASSELSRREQEVLDGLLENMANKEIANKLNISERTVKFHVSNLLAKFGVRRRADLILLCYQRRPAAS
jgi:DNA-binding NarL/FixJ family response regulator